QNESYDTEGHIDEFGDQAFQRWSDIDKVGMEALVSYLVAASMVKSLENAWFSMKLRKLIVVHTDQEKLKSKKVKLKALGNNMDRVLMDHILKGDIKLHFILTEYQLPDIFTKPLDEPTFSRLKAKLGMLNID
nr:retrovirus-related Pol polyprotein from transposon TNT 1-94 [Tanacetum cinerariifolium]